jgi:hypothetical protein
MAAIDVPMRVATIIFCRMQAVVNIVALATIMENWLLRQPVFYGQFLDLVSPLSGSPSIADESYF